jgi:hypothetical protein
MSPRRDLTRNRMAQRNIQRLGQVPIGVIAGEEETSGAISKGCLADAMLPGQQPGVMKGPRLESPQKAFFRYCVAKKTLRKARMNVSAWVLGARFKRFRLPRLT